MVETWKLRSGSQKAVRAVNNHRIQFHYLARLSGGAEIATQGSIKKI